MYKKTINYTDFNGVDRKEDFYFNFMKAELVEMNMSTGGGMKAFIERITNTQDQMELIKLFKELVLKAYGIKSDDGKRFIKNEEVLNEFKQSRAYSVLIMELISKEGAATEFFNGIMPPAMLAQMSAKIKDGVVDKDELDKMIYGDEGESKDTVVSK
jgi:hypothetical protein